ncbi:MAG: integrase core domain-containing protein [Candidatus Kaelpia imicola]|nr:integrase core domain-containing protein [Candidatus Kaelpia imicola]
MSSKCFYNTNGRLFQKFLFLLEHLVHSRLIRQIEYLKVENQILRKKIKGRIIITPTEKRRLIKYGLPLKGDIQKLISIVSYSSFRRWVKGREPQGKQSPKRGRPRTKQEIRKLAKENNWGYTRILGEIKKLRIYCLSRNTIKNILKENGLDPTPKRTEDTWDDFIKRHVKTLWACDFFTKTVWTMAGPKSLHALFFINVHTRKVHIAGITKHPNREWVTNRARSVSFLFETGKESDRKLLIRDGDGKYSKEFDRIIEEYGVRVKKIPYRSPNLNPYAEGWVGTIKRECLDYFFVFGERHFRYLVKEYVKYYNTVRPHSALNNMPIRYRSKNLDGRVKCESRLGGIIRHYYRE